MLLNNKKEDGYTLTKPYNHAPEHVADIIQSISTKASKEVNTTQRYEHTQRKKYHFGEVNRYLKKKCFLNGIRASSYSQASH